MADSFFTIKIRNENTQEYCYIYGKVDRTPTTFAHTKKYNIYGQLKQTQVAINQKVAVNVEFCSEEDKLTIEKWWETKSTIWIEQDNKTPIIATFVDTDFGLKEEIDTETDEFYYNGTLNFE